MTGIRERIEAIGVDLSPTIDDHVSTAHDQLQRNRATVYIANILATVSDQTELGLLPDATERWTRWSEAVTEPLKPAFVQAAKEGRTLRIPVQPIEHEPTVKLDVVLDPVVSAGFNGYNIRKTAETLHRARQLQKRYGGKGGEDEIELKTVKNYATKERILIGPPSSVKLTKELGATVTPIQPKPFGSKHRSYIRPSELVEIAEARFEDCSKGPIEGLHVRVPSGSNRGGENLETFQVLNPALHPPHLVGLNKHSIASHVMEGLRKRDRADAAAGTLSPDKVRQLLRSEVGPAVYNYRHVARLADRLLPLIINSEAYKALLQEAV